MKKSLIHIDPVSFGKALACTNFVFTVAVLALLSLSGVAMKGPSWQVLMVIPFVLGVAGFIYGAIGGAIYNIMSRDKREHPALEVQESNS